MKRYLQASVLIMALIGIFLTLGSLIASFGAWKNYYQFPLFIAMIVAFTVVLIICLVRFRFSFKKIGFYLCHVGLCITVIFSFVSWIFLKDSTFSIPIDPNTYYREVAQEDGSVLDFGFQISLAAFDVETYLPTYCLYDESGEMTPEHVLIETVSQNRKGMYDMGKYDTVAADQLQASYGYAAVYKVEGVGLLVKQEEADKNYYAELHIQDGEEHTVTLSVNKPYTYRGWKFYLMGYDEAHGQYVDLYVKKDPANIPLAIGIWMTLVGTFVECFHLFERKGAEQ